MSPEIVKALLDTLNNVTYDITGCLASCSNQGKCKLDPNTQKLICQCLNNFAGSSCQTDLRPCSQNKCLNNATCVNVNNMTLYECQCQSSLYYGTYCENKVNVCLNKTCSGHGYCIVVNETVPACKCFKGYQGDICDQEDSSRKLVKGVQSTSVIIAFLVLGLTVFIILSNDGWNLLIRKMRRYKIIKPIRQEIRR